MHMRSLLLPFCLFALVSCTPPDAEDPFVKSDDSDNIGTVEDSDDGDGGGDTDDDDSAEPVDEDGDGYSPDLDDQDCDDSDDTIYPGAPEVCGDGIDQDCDGTDLECDEQTGEWSAIMCEMEHSWFRDDEIEWEIEWYEERGGDDPLEVGVAFNYLMEEDQLIQADAYTVTWPTHYESLESYPVYDGEVDYDGLPLNFTSFRMEWSDRSEPQPGLYDFFDAEGNMTLSPGDVVSFAMWSWSDYDGEPVYLHWTINEYGMEDYYGTCYLTW